MSDAQSNLEIAEEVPLQEETHVAPHPETSNLLTKHDNQDEASIKASRKNSTAEKEEVEAQIIEDVHETELVEPEIDNHTQVKAIEEENNESPKKLVKKELKKKEKKDEKKSEKKENEKAHKKEEEVKEIKKEEKKVTKKEEAKETKKTEKNVAKTKKEEAKETKIDEKKVTKKEEKKVEPKAKAEPKSTKTKQPKIQESSVENRRSSRGASSKQDADKEFNELKDLLNKKRVKK